MKLYYTTMIIIGIAGLVMAMYAASTNICPLSWIGYLTFLSLATASLGIYAFAKTK